MCSASRNVAVRTDLEVCINRLESDNTLHWLLCMAIVFVAFYNDHRKYIYTTILPI